jgi:trbC/VIRB2 family
MKIKTDLEKTDLQKRFNLGKHKRVIMFFLFVMLCATSLFATDGNIAKLDDWAKIIVGLFTKTWLKAVCVIALIAICIGMVTIWRQEPGMFKKFIPWLVGVVVMLSAAAIVNFFFQDTSGLTDIG